MNTVSITMYGYQADRIRSVAKSNDMEEEDILDFLFEYLDDVIDEQDLKKV